MTRNEQNPPEHRPVEDAASDDRASRFASNPPPDDGNAARQYAERIPAVVDDAVASGPVWGLTHATPVPLVAGQPPVLVSWAWTPAPDRAMPGPAVRARLTPRLAALLVVTCTRPGDLVADGLGDPALAEAAAAGSRDYQELALGGASGPATAAASLIVMSWPSPHAQPMPPAAGFGSPADTTALEQALADARRHAPVGGGCLAILVGRAGPELDVLAPLLVEAVQRTGGGQVHRAVMLIAARTGGDGARRANRPIGRPARERRPLVMGLLFVVHFSAGGRRDRA